MKTKQFMLAALAALCLTGCASAGKPIAQGNVNQIQAGYTTETDLVRMFGPPTTKMIDMKGETSLDWYYSSAAGAQTFVPIAGPLLRGMKAKVSQLSVLMDANGKVKRYTTSSDAS